MSTGTVIDLKDKILIAIAGPEPPFELEGEYFNYSKADNDGKRRILKEQAKVVTTTMTNDEYLLDERKKFLEKIQKSELLRNENWTNERFMDGDAETTNSKFLAMKYFLARFNTAKQVSKALSQDKPNKNRREESDSELQPYVNQYKPPNRRILITENITFNELDQIPVYCDITKELDELVIPERLAFDYIDCNFVNKEKEKKLVDAINMSKERKNQIKCECAKKKLMCHKNVNYPCYRMNKAMQKIRHKGNTTAPCEFQSLGPNTLSHARNIFFDNCGFACSDECACEGNCDNNSLLIPLRHLFPLEIFQSDKDIGFSVRSPVFIPAGTPVMEFTGEIVERATLYGLSEELADEHAAYSIQWNYHDDWQFHKFFNSLNFTDEYKELLARLYKKKFYIDPTNIGNVGRMIAHSCCPNLEVLRVYRKSLSPAHVSLIMVTIEDVYPGTPFSFDYGAGYKVSKDTYLTTVCKCRLFSCQGNGSNDTFKTLDTHSMAVIIRRLHQMRRTT
ncbi:hypothetical protein CAEBREN_01406 [Caenorhabditis brenneri]|uniref:SET domain-containing protein n=1 Tax=Caenorhabditis brenneri TaxID=135651 RepID=G0NQ60_CAEBE|nr:hypothetical protein CAEBREN_01406 [Caenorhabditis brenneri]